MTKPRIALVDDDVGQRTMFETLASQGWAEVDVFGGAQQLKAAVEAGRTWDVVFVDFNLGDRAPTGLTALLWLRHCQGHVSTVVYSQFVESGRFLFALAARRWFGASAAVDKNEFKNASEVKPFVERLMRGEDPTTQLRRVALSHAFVIDELLSDPIDVLIWQAILRHQNTAAIRSALGPMKVSRARLYRWYPPKENAIIRVRNLRSNRPIDHFEAAGDRNNVAHATMVLDFARNNDQFFEAVDLGAALTGAAAEPGSSSR